MNPSRDFSALFAMASPLEARYEIDISFSAHDAAYDKFKIFKGHFYNLSKGSVCIFSPSYQALLSEVSWKNQGIYSIIAQSFHMI